MHIQCLTSSTISGAFLLYDSLLVVIGPIYKFYNNLTEGRGEVVERAKMCLIYSVLYAKVFNKTQSCLNQVYDIIVSS